MEITFLKPEDSKETLALLQESFPTVSFQNEIQLEKIGENNIVLLAKENHHVVGHIWIQKQYDFYKHCDYFYFMYICVKSEYRHLGIATRLIEEAERLKQEMNVSYITFTSGQARTEANQLYQKLGYEKKDSNVYIKF